MDGHAARVLLGKDVLFATLINGIVALVGFYRVQRILKRLELGLRLMQLKTKFVIRVALHKAVDKSRNTANPRNCDTQFRTEKRHNCPPNMK